MHEKGIDEMKIQHKKVIYDISMIFIIFTISKLFMISFFKVIVAFDLIMLFWSHLCSLKKEGQCDKLLQFIFFDAVYSLMVCVFLNVFYSKDQYGFIGLLMCIFVYAIISTFFEKNIQKIIV